MCCRSVRCVLKFVSNDLLHLCLVEGLQAHMCLVEGLEPHICVWQNPNLKKSMGPEWQVSWSDPSTFNLQQAPGCFSSLFKTCSSFQCQVFWYNCNYHFDPPTHHSPPPSSGHHPCPQHPETCYESLISDVGYLHQPWTLWPSSMCVSETFTFRKCYEAFQIICLAWNTAFIATLIMRNSEKIENFPLSPSHVT